MTLRDPATRLESGWRHDVSDHHEMDRLFHRGQPVLTLSQFVRAFANASSDAYPSVLRNYWSSVALPTTQVFNGPQWAVAPASKPPPWWATPDLGRAGGSNFLVSQLDFLRGLECSESEVHFLCTEKFSQHWMRLLDAFGLPRASGRDAHETRRAAAVANLARIHRRQRSIDANTTRLSSLSGVERDFVRRCLYPWDAELHAAICGGRKQSRDFVGDGRGGSST